MTIPTAADAKSYAITEIARLMRQYDVSFADLGAPDTEDQASTLTRIFAYIGGTLILAGLSIYLGMKWSSLDSLLRVTLTFVPGFLALFTACLISVQNRPQGHLISTPLFLVAATFECCGLFVFLNEYTSGHDAIWGTLLVCSVMAVQFFLIFSSLRSPATLFFSLFFSYLALAATFEKLEVDGDLYSMVIGLSGLLIGSQLRHTRYASITGIGFLFSGFTLSTSAFVYLTRASTLPGYPANQADDIFLIGIAVALIYASVQVQSRALLFVGICSMLAYLGYYTTTYFTNVVGWPISLMTLGIFFIIASSYAIRIGRKFTPAAQA